MKNVLERILSVFIVSGAIIMLGIVALVFIRICIPIGIIYAIYGVITCKTDVSEAMSIFTDIIGDTFQKAGSIFKGEESE